MQSVLFFITQKTTQSPPKGTVTLRGSWTGEREETDQGASSIEPRFIRLATVQLT